MFHLGFEGLNFIFYADFFPYGELLYMELFFWGGVEGLVILYGGLMVKHFLWDLVGLRDFLKYSDGKYPFKKGCYAAYF